MKVVECSLKLVRPPMTEGQCVECGVVHDPAFPHNAQSLFYQYSFREQHGRWPTWKDAVAHCAAEMQEHWRRELRANGVKEEQL